MPANRIPRYPPPDLDLTLGFEVNGVSVHREFLNKDQISKLNLELDQLFKQKTVVLSSIPRSTIVTEIVRPSAIKSINLLEIAIDIAQLLSSNDLAADNLILTNLEIFSEKNNPKPLFWHTDQRHGMMRAQIYLMGGAENSGGFLYMLGTHSIQHTVQHKLDTSEIESLKRVICDCSGNSGDLILFDAFGFHAKHSCQNERRTVMFEFQSRGSTYTKSSLLIDNRKLSEKVLKNIALFLPGREETYTGHGLDQPSSYIPFSYILTSFNLWITSKFKYFTDMSKLIYQKLLTKKNNSTSYF